MKHSILWIMLVSSITLNSYANEKQQCDANNNQDCTHPEWRPESAMSDDSRVLAATLPENSEQTLPKGTLTLWSLPPLNAIETYSKEDLKSVRLELSGPSAQFSSAKATLTPAIVERVSTLIEGLKGKRNVRLQFVGHTDNQTLSLKAQRWYKTNQALSEARAKAVATYFQQALNLPEQSITAMGLGESQPIASNTTPNGMAQNRRVEVTVWYDEAPKQTMASSPLDRRLICNGNVKAAQKKPGGFALSIDGQPVNSGSQDNQDQQRCTDVALAETQVRLQYDNLAAKRLLDVSAWQATAVAKESIKFQGYSNYLAWIDKAEVRIFDADRSAHGTPLAIVALNDALVGEWQVTEAVPRQLHYRIRVYDAQGRYDETTSLPLSRVEQHQVVKDDELTGKQSDHIAYGKTRLEKQTIPVKGGSITVHGSDVPKAHQIVVMGQAVPVDEQGNFVTQQIIPAGQHTIEVAALNELGDGALFWRDIAFKKDDWFYVGIIDVTAGRYRASQNAYTVSQNEQLNDSGFIDGRIAFYTKGKWREKYTVTASVDTREQPLNTLFSTFMDKDPRSLLRRLDDTAYYPTYGDDSTLVEDAPTQGKFYAKIEDERSHALWGNFKIVQQETDLAQINRGLYGAVIDWNSESFTSTSDSQTQINLFAADSGTQAAREEFRGTGGSLYYLSNQDIVTGSERVQVEVRDRDSDIVLSVNTLVAGQDYQEDAIQGRILLTRPLPSTADASQLVRAGSYAGHPVFLVVNYEYVGDLTNFDDFAIGGRATHWLNDAIRLGVTGSHQKMFDSDQDLNGVDVLFRKTPETYIRLEAARSKGQGITNNNSIDGGFSFNGLTSNQANQDASNAYQFETGFQLTDLGLSTEGNGYFYTRRRQSGFSGPGQLVNNDTDQMGGSFSLPLSEQDKVNLKFDSTDQDQGLSTDTVEVDLAHQINQDWTVSAGLRHDDRDNDSVIATTTDNDQGERTDLALQADYALNEDAGIYGFGQSTLNKTGNRDKNNRAGIGGHYQINDRLGLTGEVSGGNRGLGASIGTDYRLSDRTTTYLNYALDPDNANSGIGNRQGKLVSGMRNRYSDYVSVYGESQYLHGDSSRGLTQAYGIDLTPDEHWKFGLAIEGGEIDTLNSTTKRRAGSIAVNYAKDAIKYGGNLEYRRDITDSDRRITWLTRNNLSYQLDPDWRLRLQLDLAFSDSEEGSFSDADYAEALIGYAYRPVNNDKLNALFEYKFLADQAPAQQFTSTGTQNEFQQRSHVLAVDGIYDLTPRWSIGAKYAVRVGELRAGRGKGKWFDSRAQLGIGRIDWHVVKHWDALLELRVLDISEAEDTRAGVLAAVYRHFGNHVKAGVGYNFTDFSDDLTDLDYDSRGVFFNVIGKW